MIRIPQGRTGFTVNNLLPSYTLADENAGRVEPFSMPYGSSNVSFFSVEIPFDNETNGKDRDSVTVAYNRLTDTETMEPIDGTAFFFYYEAHGNPGAAEKIEVEVMFSIGLGNEAVARLWLQKGTYSKEDIHWRVNTDCMLLESSISITITYKTLGQTGVKLMVSAPHFFRHPKKEVYMGTLSIHESRLRKGRCRLLKEEGFWHFGEDEAEGCGWVFDEPYLIGSVCHETERMFLEVKSNQDFVLIVDGIASGYQKFSRWTLINNTKGAFGTYGLNFSTDVPKDSENQPILVNKIGFLRALDDEGRGKKGELWIKSVHFE